MKVLKTLSSALLVVMLLTACSHHTIIPDKKLAQIFHDAFLTNAYLQKERLHTDSLMFYEPIFARYGYTAEDVIYTIGNFSKRKSASLSSVVEQAIDLLEREGLYYDREVAILDTVNNVAMRTFTEVVRQDSLIVVRTLKDTARLNITVPTRPGEYTVRYSYRVDSLDQNNRLTSYMWLDARDSSRENRTSVLMRQTGFEQVNRSFRADTTHTRLRLSLLNFTDKLKRPSVTIQDLCIRYIPQPEEAVERLYEQQLGLRIFADEFIHAALEAEGEKAEDKAESSAATK